MCPCRAFYDHFFVFFFLAFFSSEIWVFVLFEIFGVLRGIPHFQRKKKKHSYRARQGRSRHVCNNSGSYLSKTAWTFGLLCGEVQESRLRIVMTWFQCTFDLGRSILFNIGPTQSILRIFAYKQALEHLEAVRSAKNGRFFFLLTVDA